MTATSDTKSPAIKNMQNTEYTAEGVHYNDEVNSLPHLKNTRNRVIKTQPAPRIYVNDGSNGSNLVYSESYKLYTTSKLTPRVTSSYSNNFPREETKSTVYNSVDGTKLHKYGDSGGFSDYLTIRKR